MGKPAFTANGKEIVRLRGLKGWSQLKLANESLIGKKTVERLESEQPATLATIAAIAAALDVPVQQLLLSKEGVSRELEDPHTASPLHVTSSRCTPTAETFKLQILDFHDLIERSTRGFVGRQFLRRSVDAFIGGGDNPPGYLFLQGVPGIGKTAFMAALVKERQYYLHHFNRAIVGANTADLFLKNICARLVVQFGLGHYRAIPDDITENGEFLARLLNECSRRLDPNSFLVVLIDALDEVDRSTLHPRANLLYLPDVLPDRVYVLATTRLPLDDLPLRVVHSQTLVLKTDSFENRQDAREYIESQIDTPGVREWMITRHLTRQAFIEELLTKSEGNFMYLRHVMTAISAGWLRGLEVQFLPQGLQSYYRDHWRHMLGANRDSFDELYKPVICVLAFLAEPLSVPEIVAYTAKAEMKLAPDQVRHVLDQWREYLEVDGSSDQEVRYRLYHNAFREFLSSPEVDDKFRDTRRRIWEAIERDMDSVET